MLCGVWVAPVPEGLFALMLLCHFLFVFVCLVMFALLVVRSYWKRVVGALGFLELVGFVLRSIVL